MKKGLVTTIVIAVVALGIFSWVKSTYNGMVEGEEKVKSAWSQVENVYQRRADLIPNLVATVKGYAEHERGTLESVISARARATQITVDPDKLTGDAIAQFQNRTDGQAHGHYQYFQPAVAAETACGPIPEHPQPRLIHLILHYGSHRAHDESQHHAGNQES